MLPDALRERGAEVDVAGALRTVAEPLDDDARAAVRGADWFTFTSASSARFLAAAAAARWPARGSRRSARSRARRCARSGCEPDLEAEPSTRPTGSSPPLVAADGAR